MDSFTGLNMMILRKELNQALAPIAKKHNISLTVGGLTYSPTECTAKLMAGCAKNDEGKIMQPYEKAFHDVKSFTSGMKNIGDTFVSRGRTFTISGWKPRNRVYPLLATRDDGKFFKFPKKYAF